MEAIGFINLILIIIAIWAFFSSAVFVSIFFIFIAMLFGFIYHINEEK